MSEQDRNLIHSPQETQIKAKSFKIKASAQNFRQYVETVKAYVAAHMPFDHIVHAAMLLDDEVDQAALDAMLKEGWEQKASEIAENENEILAFQNRGEIVTDHQIEGPAYITGKEVVMISQEVGKPTTPNEVPVLEGIGVSINKPVELVQPDEDEQLSALRKFIVPEKTAA